MKNLTRRAATILLFFALTASLHAQITVAPEAPDEVFVCGSDDFKITFINGSASPVTGVTTTVALPQGMTYVPGTVLGASESNISDLENPVFSLPNLAANSSTVVTMKVELGCSMVGPINAGAFFSISVKTDFAGGSTSASTGLFKGDTGLLLISSIQPPTQSGERDDVLTRTVRFVNTRKGRIGNLLFEDEHGPGLSISTTGAVSQSNLTNSFSADFDGNFFKNFGDGDEWLEENETGEIVEEITITDCGIPEKFVTSKLRLGWGCDAERCQYDSTLTGITIEPFSRNPDLVFTPFFGVPFDRCGNSPAVQRLHIVNVGRGDAKNVLVTLQPGIIEFMGINPNSIRIVKNGVTTPLPPNLSTPSTLKECQKTFASSVIVSVPLVPALDSLDLLFDLHTCMDECRIPPYYIWTDYFYTKTCPVGGFDVKKFWFPQDTDFFNLKTDLYYKVGTCLEDQHSYDFSQMVASARLNTDTGVLRLGLELPWGLFLDENCLPLLLDGKPPLYFHVDSVPGSHTLVNLFFDLPLSSDSLTMPLCIKYLCQKPMPCKGQGGAGDEQDFIVYVADPPCPSQAECLLVPKVFAGVAANTNINPNCVPSRCREKDIIVLDVCDGGDSSDVGSNVCSGNGCEKTDFRWDFQTFRTNYGYRDDNNDRNADNLNPPDTTLARTDRFIPGDTMRLVYKGFLASGNCVGNWLTVRVFTESLMSEIFHDGGDFFKLREVKYFLNNRNLFRLLDASVRIRRASTGEVFECPLPNISFSSLHKKYGLIQWMNVSPPKNLDALTTMHRNFFINFQQLEDDGFLPPDFDALQPGDSIEFVTNYKFDFNFKNDGAGSAEPPLVNFRTNICDTCRFYAWKAGEIRRSQYSGAVDSIGRNQFAIRPCDNSAMVKPFEYNIRLAKPNLFPFEVRPIAQILESRLRKSPLLTPVSATLREMRLQDNVQIFKDLPLPFTFQDSFVFVDFEQPFAAPLDEGFYLKSDLIFGPQCNFQLPDSLNHWIKLWNPPCMFADTSIRTEFRKRPLGYFANVPVLDLTTTDTIVFVPAGDGAMNFTITNLPVSPAQNVWLYLLPGSTEQTDFEVFTQPGQQAVTPVNGVFQLGLVLGQNSKTWQIRFKNKGCENTTLRLVYGWNCTPFDDPTATGCARDTFTVEIRPENPELELAVLHEPASVPLCDSSEYFEFEIYNANRGFAYHLFASLKLPQGIHILPGSCQISYPAGTAYVPIPDPTSLPDNAYRWSLSDLFAATGGAGLPGVNLAPQNAIRLRFKVLTECGVVSNAQAVYGVDGQQICGDATNSLRKPGLPILVEGLNTQYGAAISIGGAGGPLPGEVPCGGNLALQIRITLDGPAQPGDSIYVTLPGGLVLAPNGYVPGLNMPNAAPVVNGNVLRLPLPANLPAGSVVEFVLGVKYESYDACIEKVITVQTRARTTAFCPTINANCDVYVASGEASYLFPGVNAALEMTSLDIHFENDSLAFSAVLENISDHISNGTRLQFFYDENGDGQITPGEPLLHEAVNTQGLNPGSTRTLDGKFALDSIDFCRVVAAITAEANCLCESKFYPLSGLTIAHDPLVKCLGETTALGIPTQPDHSYAWTPTVGLSCTNCSEPTLTPQAGWLPGQAQQFLLEDQSGNCSVKHTFSVTYVEKPFVLTPDATVCRGDSVRLETSAGVAVVWQGPGIQNPTAGQQWVSPSATAIFTATLTLGACESRDSVRVEVLPTHEVVLPKILICKGLSADVFGVPTSTPGVFSKIFKNQNGCDSTVTVELEVLEIETSEARMVCDGDSILVFDTLVSEAGVVCRSFKNALGCDSTHCIAVSKLPPPSVVVGDSLSVEAGGSVTLSGPAGFEKYEWSPSAGLSCADCRNPTATPTESTTYTLKVTDDKGCTATVTWRVTTFPPCDPQRPGIPNAITPNGDGDNDVFRVVPLEGVEEVVSMEIYDRWGQRVYRASGPTAVWDATIDGKPAPSDVYVYIIRIRCSDVEEPRVGDVVVLR